LTIVNTIDLHQASTCYIANKTEKVGYVKYLSYLCSEFAKKISNNRRTKGVPHKRRKDNIMLTFGIVTIVAAVIAEALIVSKKINLD